MLAPYANTRWLAIFKPVFLLGIFLAGCGERPPFPRWPQQTPTLTEQVVLSDNLSVTDLRQIARAINGSGRLQSLQPWVESISDDQLTLLGRLIYDFIYQDALSSGSAIDLLEQRIDRKFFTDFALAVEFLSLGKDTGEMFEVVKTLIGHSKFPQLVDLNIHWIDPMWGAISRAQNDRLAKAEPEDLSDLGGDGVPSFDAPSGGAKGWVAEAHMLAHDPALDGHWKKIARILRETHFLGNTISYIGGRKGTKTGADPAPLATILPRVRKMATEKWALDPKESQLTAFLRSAHTLNGPAAGLFAQIHRALEKTGAARTFGDLLQPHKRIATGPLTTLTKYQPLVPNVVLGYMRRNMTEGIREVPTNTDEFWKSLAKGSEDAYDGLHRSIVESIQDVTGTALDTETTGAAHFNMPIYVNAHVMTEWFLHVVQNNQAALNKVSRKEFSKKLWESLLKFDAFHVAVTDATGAFLPEVREKLRRGLAGKPDADIDASIAGWEKALQNQRTGEWRFDFAGTKKSTWSDAVRDAVQACDKLLPFADVSAVIRIALFYATEPGANGLSPLQQLDGDNLLLRVNERLSGMPPEGLQMLASLGSGGTDLAELVHLFRDVVEKEEVAEPPRDADEAKERLEMAERRNEIFDALETLAGLLTILNGDKGFDSGKTLLAYMNWIKAIGPDGLPAVGDILSLVHGSGLLKTTFTANTAKFEYPALAERVLGTELAPPTLLGFGHWEIPEIFELERAIGLSVKGPDPASLYLDWLRTLPPRRTESWDGIAEVFKSSAGGIGDSERLWIQNFVRRSGVHRVWGFFGANASWGRSSGLFRELVKLAEQGSIAGPLDLFEQIRDDRIKRIARVMKKWYHSGQFLVFLKAGEKLFQNAPASK